MRFTSVWRRTRVVDFLQVRCLESDHGRLDLALVLFHAKQLYHALDFDLDPWRLVCGHRERENVLCQAPLLLALTAEHSILLDRSQAGARRGRVLVTHQYIRFAS